MINKNCGIYKITSPTGKIYIGQGVNLEKRKSYYRVLDCKSQPKIYNSIAKHGWDAHQFDIIEYCDEEDLNCSERFWQDEFDVLGKNGLNCILTECGAKRTVFSEEFRKRKSLAQKGVKKPHIQGEAHPMFGKKHTPETVAKIRNSKLGKNKGAESPRSKIVLDTQTGVFYYCAREAAEVYGISYANLRDYLNPNNKRKNPTSLIYV